jgi:hypothetical protein
LSCSAVDDRSTRLRGRRLGLHAAWSPWAPDGLGEHFPAAICPVPETLSTHRAKDAALSRGDRPDFRWTAGREWAAWPHPRRLGVL